MEKYWKLSSNTPLICSTGLAHIFPYKLYYFNLKQVLPGTHVKQWKPLETKLCELCHEKTCECGGWSAPLLFAYGINRFSHDGGSCNDVWFPTVNSRLHCPKFSTLSNQMSGGNTQIIRNYLFILPQYPQTILVHSNKMYWYQSCWFSCQEVRLWTPV